jgi:hypothetical protein
MKLWWCMSKNPKVGILISKFKEIEETEFNWKFIKSFHYKVLNFNYNNRYYKNN